MIQPKNYLRDEGKRNRTNAALYSRLVQLAFGADNAVIVGHHINFEKDGKIETENEIPAADTLLFDHDIMGAIFGDDAYAIMQTLACVRAEFREEYLDEYLDMYGVGRQLAPPVDERTKTSDFDVQLASQVASDPAMYELLGGKP